MTKTETNNCFIIHCFELNNDKLGTVRPNNLADKDNEIFRIEHARSP